MSSADNPDREEFLARFMARMHALLGVNYDAKYIDRIAPTYWEDTGQREEGPEFCADAEFSEWGSE